MAEGKNKVLVYCDWKSTFDKLTDEEAGKLIKHFFSYINDDNPEPVDRLTELVFEPIKQTLKRDLKSWETRAERSRENGLKGGRPPKQENPKEPTETHQVILEPKEPVKDIVSVSVSDNVSVNESDILLKKETKDNIKAFDFKKSLIEFGVSKEVANDWMEVRRKKKASNTETAFKTLVNEINKTGRSPDECITEAVARSWQGFKAEWITNIKHNGNTTQEKRTLEQQAQSVVDRITAKYSNENATGADGSTTEDSYYKVVE